MNALVIAACGPTTTTTGESDASTEPDATTDASTTVHGTTGETTGGDLVCPCIPDDQVEGWGVVPSIPTCGAALCPDVHAAIDPKTGETTLMDPDALRCALEALRDRTPGILAWHWLGHESSTDDGYVLIRDDGQAVSRRWAEEDLLYEVTDAVLGELPASGVYTACLAEASAELRFDCLREPVLARGSVVCDEGWVADGI
ncbi:MAG: hypothetical protein R3B09_09985 [Nannocystaceae bacterium]